MCMCVSAHMCKFSGKTGKLVYTTLQSKSAGTNWMSSCGGKLSHIASSQIQHAIRAKIWSNIVCLQVNREIVAGLKYHHVTYRKGVRGKISQDIICEYESLSVIVINYKCSHPPYDHCSRKAWHQLVHILWPNIYVFTLYSSSMRAYLAHANVKWSHYESHICFEQK